MYCVKLESNTPESFAHLNQGLLERLLPENIEYSQIAMDLIEKKSGIDPKSVLQALKKFDFEVDSFNCEYKVRGFLYSDKYCLRWQILYRDKLGAILEDVHSIVQCEDLDPYVYVMIHNKRDEWDEGRYWPNSALSI